MKPNSLRYTLGALLIPFACFPAFGQNLLVDFNSTSQGGGPNNETDYQPYNAGHEVQTDFISKDFAAFGGTVTIDPTWPDTADNRVQQMIDRGNGNDANWGGTRLQLITDFIGIDTRTGNGGNGDWDGTIGIPTSMEVKLGNVPTDNYILTTYHHDTENVHADFLVEISLDGGTTFTTVTGPNADQTFSMTSSSPGGNPGNPNTQDGIASPASGDPKDLSSTVSHSFTATGSDIVLKYTPYSNTAVHKQIFALNGLELAVDGDTDGDGMPDPYESSNGLDPNDDGTIGESSPGAKDGPNGPLGDPDNDGLANIEEYNGVDGNPGTGDETNPQLDDTDGDGLSDGEEVKSTGTNPLSTDSDGDFFDDSAEKDAGTDGNDKTSFPVPASGLLIDFSASGNAGQTGPVHDGSYLPYVAGDGVDGEVNRTETYPASIFGGADPITFDVAFPNPDGASNLPSTATRMIGRNAGSAANYSGANQAMIRDWIGFDNRLASGGNGTDTESAMEFTITGLPAGKYLYLSHHHDTGAEQGDFTVSVTDATRTNQSIFSKSGTSSNQFDVANGASPRDLPSTSNFIIESLGEAIPVLIRYSSIETGEALEGFVAVNGIEITPALDDDSDGIPNAREDEVAGIESNVNDSGLDLDSDTLGNLDEYYQNTLIDNDDTDTDGLKDGEEITAGSNPHLEDTDGDGLSDGREVNELGSDPTLTDSDGDTFSDSWEALAGSDLSEAASIPDTDGDGFSASRENNDNNGDDFPLAGDNQLFVDFNSNQSGGGDSTGFDNPAESEAFNNQKGYSSYHANHEDPFELVTATYNAFGRVISVTPQWPDSEGANTTQQSIGRGDGNNANWHGDQLNLLRDWIGVDTRTGQSGNGAYDGTTGAKTRLQLVLGNLPAFDYTWRSYHHDTENVHAGFLMEISTDGGATFTVVEGPNDDMTFPGTDSTNGGNPGSPRVYTGAENGFIDPVNLPSTAEASFTANGADDVIIQFTPYTVAAVHRALFAMNGFELTGPFGFGGGVRITSAEFNENGDYILDFTGNPNTEYELTKSLTLNEDFASIPAETDTDGTGTGQFVIPAAFLTDAKAFFRVEALDE